VFPAIALTVTAGEQPGRSGAARPERAPLSGVVIHKDDPTQTVSRARISGTSTGREGLGSLRIVAGSDGRFDAERRLVDMLVCAKSPDLSLGGIVELPADAKEVTIPVGPTASAEGRILDRDGNPFAGYEVSAKIVIDLGEGASRRCFGTASKADENGRFELPGLVVGQKYRLSVTARQHSYWTVLEFVVPHSGAFDLGEPRLRFHFQQSATSGVGLQVEAVDRENRPVSAFEAMLYTHHGRYVSWQPGCKGKLYFPSLLSNDVRGSRDRSNRVELVVRSEGYAPAVRVLGESNRDEPIKMILERGRHVEMTLHRPEGIEIPDDLLPDVYFADHQGRVRVMRQPQNVRPERPFELNYTSLTSLGGGRYEFRVPTDSPPVSVSIDHPGFLHRFEAGPFTADDLADGRLDVDLPEPATLNVAFVGPTGSQEEVPYKSSYFELFWHIPPTTSTLLTVARSSAEGRDHEAVFYGLASGKYHVSLATAPRVIDRQIDPDQPHPGAFRDYREIKLKAGQTADVRIDYVPFDPTAYRGDYSASLKVSRPDGALADGLPFEVQYGHRNYGVLTAMKGTIPDGSVIRLEEVAGGSEDSWYTLKVDGDRIGSFRLSGPEKHRTLEFKLIPRAGDLAPNVTMFDAESLEQVKLSDFRGRVVYLEFWATWCGPCQKPLAELDALWLNRRSEWDGKVALVPLSLNSDVEALQQHVRLRGWRNVRHFWAGESEDGFDSPAAQAFVVTGVPTAVFIDQKGKILWRGHPHQYQAEKEIDRLLEAR